MYIKLRATKDLRQPSKMTSEMIESAWTSRGYFLFQLDPDIRLERRLEYLYLKIKKNKNNPTYSSKRVFI